jgi:release factor glutamine methyltransferase
MSGGVTVGTAFREASRRLAAAGVASAHIDARLLVGRALGVGPEVVVAHPERQLEPAARRTIEGLLARRAAREPMSHILGAREFWGLDFAVSGDVLDPRPDSETVVGAALVQVGRRDRPLRMLDFGTGSGCLLLALLHELPAARGIGVDLSASAINVARVNAARLGLADRAAFAVGRWGEGLTGRFDLVVANPPYIRSGDLGGLAPEVARFEPRLALDGGADGLASYRALAPDIARLLAPGGAAVVEFGAGQAAEVGAIMAAAGLAVLAVVPDLADRARCAVLAI